MTLSKKQFPQGKTLGTKAGLQNFKTNRSQVLDIKKAISPKHGEVPGSGSPLPQSAMEHTGQQLLPWSDL